MKKKTLTKKNYLRDKMFFIIVALSIAAISFSVYAVLQTTSLTSEAYRSVANTCGTLCRPDTNQCPSTAPFCIPVTSYASRIVYRCSMQADALNCSILKSPLPTCSPERDIPCVEPLPQIRPDRMQ